MFLRFLCRRSKNWLWTLPRTLWCKHRSSLELKRAVPIHFRVLLWVWGSPDLRTSDMAARFPTAASAATTGNTHSHGHQRSARPLKGELGGSEGSMLSRNHLGPLLPGPYAGIHSASDFRGDFVSHCWRLAAAHEGRVMAFRGAFAVTSLSVTLLPAFPIHDMSDSDIPDTETSWRFVKHEREGAR